MEKQDWCIAILVIICLIEFLALTPLVAFATNIISYYNTEELYKASDGTYYEIKRVDEVIIKNGKAYRFTVNRYMEKKKEEGKE